MYQMLGTGGMGSPGNGPLANFRAPRPSYSFTVRGVTRDANLAALAGCTVKLFETSTDLLVGTALSDGSGNWSVPVSSNSSTYYAVAYKAGAPDVEGTTSNALIAS